MIYVLLANTNIIFTNAEEQKITGNGTVDKMVGMATKIRKYYHICGVCGEEFDPNDMVRDEGSDTGWLCIDCYIA